MKIYGIKNCDTVKKSLKLLDEGNKSYEFVDFKKSPPPEDKIKKWIELKGKDVVINKRGMMWKKLPEDKRSNLSVQSALKIALETPSIIKRPVVEVDNKVFIGFDELKEIVG